MVEAVKSHEPRDPWERRLLKWVLRGSEPRRGLEVVFTPSVYGVLAFLASRFAAPVLDIPLEESLFLGLFIFLVGLASALVAELRRWLRSR